jgi:hypothetical protein
MAKKITKKQKDLLFSYIAYLIVNKKDDLVLTMNKSNIKTVNNKTPNKILANIVVEELNKNEQFRKNLSELITNEHLKSILENKKLNSTGSEQGVNVQDAVSLSTKIYEGVTGLAGMFGIGKKQREDSKLELNKMVADQEKDKKQEERIDNTRKIAKNISSTGVILIILGASAIAGLSYILYKKYYGDK